MFLTRSYFKAWMEHNLMFLKQINQKLETLVADVSGVLNDVANGLNDMGENLGKLVAENSELRARNAELEGEDAKESEAADNVVKAFNNVASKLTKSSDAPDVDPVEVPTENPAPESNS